MAILSYDAIESILLLLPLKSLLRFKCISKPWHSLISNSLFIQSHLRRSYNRPLLLFECSSLFPELFGTNNVVEILESYSCGGGESVPLDSIFPSLTLRSFHSQCNLMDREHDSSYTVMCACDGLVVLKFRYCRGQRESLFYVMWNPFTRESREIHPVSNSVYGADFCLSMGYDLWADDYKVIRTNRETRFGWILSLRSDTWRKIDLDGFCFGGSGIYARGHLHWPRENSETFGIVGFSLVEEKCTDLAVPDIQVKKWKEIRVSVCDECLCILCFGDVAETREFFVWTLKEYGDPTSWTQRSIKVSHIWGDIVIPCFQTEFRIWFSEIAVLAGAFVEKLGKWKYELYDAGTRKVATLETDIELLGPARLSTFLLHETLVSPNPNNLPWTSMGNYRIN